MKRSRDFYVTNETIKQEIEHYLSSNINNRPPITYWDTSQVTNMDYLFQDMSTFNEPIFSWDTSNVTSMVGMFTRASSFNQSLNEWDMSNVEMITGMFSDAISFNQPLNYWNTSNVIDMCMTFAGALSFNQSLNDWDVSNVVDMSAMFSNASSFDQPLNKWDVSKVVSMDRMFAGAIAFNQSLSEWNVSKVLDMSGMFDGAIAFRQSLSAWKVGVDVNVKDAFTNLPRGIKPTLLRDSMPMQSILLKRNDVYPPHDPHLLTLNETIDNQMSNLFNCINTQIIAIVNYDKQTKLIRLQKGINLTIPLNFCGNKLHNEYLFNSINTPEHSTIINYYNHDDIHSIITYTVNIDSSNTYFVYIDVLCVNSIQKYYGASILLKNIINICKQTTDIQYIELASVLDPSTLEFYKKHNFKSTGFYNGLSIERLNVKGGRSLKKTKKRKPNHKKHTKKHLKNII